MAVQMMLWGAVRRALAVPALARPAAGVRATSREAACSVHSETRCEIVLSLLRGSGDRGLDVRSGFGGDGLAAESGESAAGSVAACGGDRGDGSEACDAERA